MDYSQKQRLTGRNTIKSVINKIINWIVPFAVLVIVLVNFVGPPLNCYSKFKLQENKLLSFLYQNTPTSNFCWKVFQAPGLFKYLVLKDDKIQKRSLWGMAKTEIPLLYDALTARHFTKIIHWSLHEGDTSLLCEKNIIHKGQYKVYELDGEFDLPFKLSQASASSHHWSLNCE